MFRFWIHFFVLYAVMAAVWPYFPAFLRAVGFDEAQVGYLQGVRMLCGALGPLLLAWLSDRLGRRKLLLGGCFVGFLALIVPLSMASSFWLAVPLAAGVGLTLRTTIPLSDTLAAAELDDPVHQYGQVRIGGSIGFIATLFAIRLLGLIDEHSAASMVRGMVVMTVAALVALQFLPERQRSGGGRKRSLEGGFSFGPGFWVFLGAAGLQQLGMSSYYGFFTIYLQDVLGMEQAAWVWALGSMAEIPVLFYAGRLTRRFPLPGLMTAAMVGVTVRLAVYAFFPTAWLVLPAQLLHALAFGAFHATCIEFIRRRVPDSHRAVAMAFYMSLAVAVPLLVGSSVGGLIVKHIGYTALYAGYATFPLIGIALLGGAWDLVQAPAGAAVREVPGAR